MKRLQSIALVWPVLIFALLAAMVVGGAPAAAFSSLGGETLPANEGPHAGIASDGRVWYVPMQRKEIALTFDDGPYPFYTPLLLHQLAMEEQTPATFFLVGRTVQEYPQLVERILAAGGEVGNHTFNHYSLTGLSDEEIADQIADCGALLSQYTGSALTLFRPPHGRYDARVVEIARRLGYRTILWSDAPDDAPKDNSEVPVPVIVQRVLTQAKPGGIILLHSGQYNTIEAIPQIVDTLHAEGYTFVTVSQLLADQT
jgi:peptidoglycan/xylan/chitin deacetylase (PgdA/CDA1 family)